jgi:hypothetical protein
MYSFTHDLIPRASTGKYILAMLFLDVVTNSLKTNKGGFQDESFNHFNPYQLIRLSMFWQSYFIR